jgi:4-amino-4-deoxy-L-arabinose transferase-like glycosyltransferase
VNAAADTRRTPTALLLLLFFLALIALHAPLLRLPYYWDEAGYYIPAARDLLLTGSLIPRSTVSNAHPPLVMAYLALAWKLAGFSPAVTRLAMLLVAAFTLTGVFRLARRVANTEVAVASVICAGLYPVFFAQSAMAHLDLAAAGFTIWGLLAYVEDREWKSAMWFSLAVLTKETAILAPISLLLYSFIAVFFLKRLEPKWNLRSRPPFKLALPVVVLAVWYGYHWSRTGFIFGNPEFLRYNLESTLHPIRILLALGMRLWQVLGYMNLYLLTLATILAMWLPALSDDGRERPRIALDVQFSLLAVIAGYILAMAVIGGAVLARYLLPVLPLVMIVFISTLWRRVRYWRAVVAIVAVAFVAALFVNPPYGFAMEDNLAYRDYILLHEQAEAFLQAHYPSSHVLTAWPASDEITRPYLGYVERPTPVFRIEDFRAEQLYAAAELPSNFDVALIFSTKYEAPPSLFDRWRLWQHWKREFFGFHRDVPPIVAAQILGGQIVYADRRKGQWVAVIAIDRIEEAELRDEAPGFPGHESRHAIEDDKLAWFSGSTNTQ